MEYINDAINIWKSLPNFVQAFLLMVGAVFALVEVLKRVFINYQAQKNRKRSTYAAAFIIGACAAAIGAYMQEPKMPWYFWAFSSFTVGYVTTLLHRAILLLIAWKFPKFAEKLKGAK